MRNGLACVAALLAFGAGAAAVGAPSWTIRASATFQRLGPWQISDTATYADALAALGPADSCKLHAADPSWAGATWKSIGVNVELRTYGGIPPRQTGCTAPRSIHVHTVRVVGRDWHTSFGLHAGDSVGRLRSLYPNAPSHAGLSGWYGRGYWLVTRRTTCAVGDCTPRKVTIPQLVAEVAAGRVTGFLFLVGAEGE